MQESAMGEKALRFLREMAGVVVPVLLLTLAAGALLRMLNKAPEHIQPEQKNVVLYQSIEEAERTLRIRILVPSYFPDYLAWPPLSIRSERKPKFKVTLEFRYQDRNQLALTLEESFPEEGKRLVLEPPPRPWHREFILLNGSQGEMISWIDEEGFLWHNAKWKARGRLFEAKSILPEEEFLRILRSILK